METHEQANSANAPWPEPQAFVVNPDSDFNFLRITKGQFEALKEGDQATWDDLAAGLKDESSTENNKPKEKQGGFLQEIEPSRANQAAWDQARRVWEQSGAIKPPFEKDLLCRIARTSGVVQECIRTYCTVIEGYGHTFKPVLDLDSDEAYEQVKWSIWNNRVELGGKPALSEPTETEIQERLAKLKTEIRFQKMQAERFFRNSARIKGQPVGFIKLRQRIRQDYEVTGEWYLEALRDFNGAIRRLSYLPSVGMRQMPLEEEMQKVAVKERVDDFTVIEQTEYRQFRKYLQVDPDHTQLAYFKEFGDRRVMSSRSGKYYQSIEELEREEEGVKAATEVITDGIPDPETPYGVARWTANSPAIGGSRKAEEVNFSYFDNKTIPPFIILVSGGRLSSDAQEYIKTYLRALKGSENFHKLLVLEAAPFAANMPGQPPQRVQIEVVPLIKFQKDDGLFLKYLAFNDTRIGANFACPPLLRGRSEEYTRATARETLRFFEKMVAEPERLHFDELINTNIMLALGITLVRYESLGADTSDPEVVTKVLDVLFKHGAIMPNDGRQEAERLLRRELPKMTEDFMFRPLKMTVAQIAMSGNQPKEAKVLMEEEFEDNGEEDTSYIDILRKQLKSGIVADFEGDRKETTWMGMEQNTK